MADSCDTPAMSFTRPVGSAATDDRISLVDRLATHAVTSRLSRLVRGRLTVGLPDGSTRRFTGAEPGWSAEIQVHRWRLFRRMALHADIGLGEAWMDGDWTSTDPVSAVRLFLDNETALSETSILGWPQRVGDRLRHLARDPSRRRARTNIRAHYDLGNDFYRLFLDPTLTYSAAVFSSPELSLEEAQLEKYRRLAELAGLRRGMRVLEIGCGWGGFAEYAAGHLGCHVTGLTLSPSQAEAARRRLADRGLDSTAEIRIQDYREVSGQWDAVVSIEMLEAVGHRHLGEFFATCDRMLAPGGRVALQVITFPDRGYDGYRRRVDWLRKYIFPGGHLPSLGAMLEAMAARTTLTLRSVEDRALDYAETLKRWRRRVIAARDAILRLGYDERFLRMWLFYLATCEAAFAHRKIAVLQMGLARTGEPVLAGGPGGSS